MTKITKPVRLIELFGGIGAQAMAFEELGVPFEHYRLVEFDKYPVMSYNAIHGTDFVPLDIRYVHAKDLGIMDTDKYTYFMTYSFPCQDLSKAGAMRGMKKGSNTRSGLLWEVERILNECDELPQILLMENVPQVHNKKNKPDFDKWLKFLKKKGYKSFWQDLNAKEYGIAQNRERCFCISILGEGEYQFPEAIGHTEDAPEYLEKSVEKNHYLSGEKVKIIVDSLLGENKILTDRQLLIDLSVYAPRIKQSANCIAARTDRGISNRRAEGNGVLELQIHKKRKC